MPADGSAAAEIAAALPQSRVLKAFNTTFAATLAAGTVGALTTTVLIAGDDADAKSALAGVVTSGGLEAVDAGSLSAGPRARGARLPAAHPRRRREGLLDRRLRRRRLTAHPPTTERKPTDDRQRRPPQPRRAVRGRPGAQHRVLPAGLRHDGHGARAPRQRRLPAPPPVRATTTTSACSASAQQPPRPHGSLGLYHLAWQVDTIEELEEARLTLANLDAYTGESSHGATKSVYGRDPDGNEFEVMWMLPKAELGRLRERGTGRAARPARRGTPVGRRPHRRRAGPAGRA